MSWKTLLNVSYPGVYECNWEIRLRCLISNEKKYWYVIDVITIDSDTTKIISLMPDVAKEMTKWLLNSANSCTNVGEKKFQIVHVKGSRDIDLKIGENGERNYVSLNLNYYV